MDSESEVPPPKKRARRRLVGGGGDGGDSDNSSDGGSDDDASMGDGDITSQGQSPDVSRRQGGANTRRRPGFLNDDDDDSDSDDDQNRRRRNRRDDNEEDDGEDLLDNAANDYRAIAELDRYDDEMLDKDDYDVMSGDARQAAETMMAQRDREAQAEARGNRVPQALQDSDDDDSDSDDEDEARRRRMRNQFEDAAAPEELDSEPASIDLHNFNVPLREWMKRVEVQHEVRRQFGKFIRDFTSEGKRVYEERIRSMCACNAQSLEVSYIHLSESQPTLAIWLADNPLEMLKHFDVVAKKIVLEQFKSYDDIHNDIYVRITNLPLEDSLRDLRTLHLNSLVRVSGVVTRRTSVMPMLKTVYYKCSCRATLGPIERDMDSLPQVPVCLECEGEGKVILDEAKSEYQNFQKILLQESPGTVPAGRVPRYKDVYLLGDLIDTARPGEEVEITGVYVSRQNRGLNSQHGFPIFKTLIIGNSILKKEDLLTTIQITEDDRKQFREVARFPRIAERVIGSIAPSIYGCEHVKTGLAMAMFGGQEKNVQNKHRIRGDINVLLMGDPGTAKSQCLKYVEKTAPRTVYTTGKGASAVGLTAAVQKDPITREWVLEGGALVLADRGVCLIDEFDKMNDQDRTSIHEAMEQQSISISKAGIVTTLQARCSVIAAANPIGGRYDPQKSFAENVELTDPIIQRFDVLCVLQDTVDPVADERLARFVVSSHVKAHPDGCITTREAEQLQEENPNSEIEQNVNSFSDWTADNNPPGGLLDQEFLRKYILYARSLRPVLHQVDKDKLCTLYGELRRESLNSGGVPIAVRHMESIIRMSEAYARMHLRESVSMEDIDMAIRVMLESFICAQKYSIMRSLRRSFQKYIIYKKDNNELLMYILQELVKDNQHLIDFSRRNLLDRNPAENDRVEISTHELERKAHEIGLRDLSLFYKSDIFKQRGFLLQQTNDPARRKQGQVIVKHF